jgi:hypothetical protein
MTFIFIAIVLIAFGIHMAIKKESRSREKIVETLLFYMLLFFVGFSGLMAFMGHIFMADKVAQSIGWPTGSPFQAEVGVTNLAFGVLGILCIWFRKNFWLATSIGYSTFLLGAAFVHIREITVHQNLVVNNAGAILWINDIAIPLVLITLAIIYTRTSGKDAG